MKLDTPLRDVPLAAIAEEARRYERMGFDAVWTFEAAHDPFLPLAQVALATERLHFGTNVTIAFARSPFALAQTAWDLQALSGGRLHLGIGTQVRAHVERRFSMPFDHPAARVKDYIRCLHAIWDTFQTGVRPRYEGPFYRFTLINDFFNPGPIDHPTIPVYLAGVGTALARAAGEVADGFHAHPMHSAGYLRDVVRPALDEGARAGDRIGKPFEVHASVFVVTGETERERARAESAVRQQIAFYASTPSYRAFLEYHDCVDAGRRLSALMREGKLAEMAAEVPDTLLEAVAIFAPPAEITRALRARCVDGGLNRASLYLAPPPDANEDQWRALVRAFDA